MLIQPMNIRNQEKTENELIPKEHQIIDTDHFI